MSARDWSKWPKRSIDALNNAGGVLGIIGIGLGVVGVVAAAPVIIGAGLVTSFGTISYALYSGFPLKKLNPNTIIGQKIPLSELSNLSEDLVTIGIFGAESSGKSTYLSHAISSNQQPAVTQDTSATIVNLQTVPPRKIALLDGDGRTFSQQFNVVRHAKALIIFLDHTKDASDLAADSKRLEQHELYLNQLSSFLINESLSGFKLIHFVLNKRDLWEKGTSKDQLDIWFDTIVNNWRGKNFSRNVIGSRHSNIYSSDVNSLTQTIVPLT